MNVGKNLSSAPGSSGQGSLFSTEQITEFKSLLKLGGPLALGEIGWMSTYVVDAIMIGHLPSSALAISASSLGNSIFYAIAFAVIFLLNGLETLVAQAYGRRDSCECVLLLMQSFWFVALGTPLIVLSTLGVFAALPHLGTPPQVLAETKIYLKPLLWSSLPLLLYMGLRRFLQSCDSVLWVTASLLLASGVNWLFDWIFLFGHLGVRPMGIAGSAWSTNVVRLFMLSLLVAGTLQTFHRLQQWPTWRMLKPEWCRLKELFHIGWPSGVESLAEFGTTTCLAVLCARLGPVLLAANQVLLDLTALVYQVAVGIGYATVVRVGQSAGRNDVDGVSRATSISVIFGIALMASAGVFFVSFAHSWASLYTNSSHVVDVAVPIFKLCSLTLITDTILVLIASALTGIGDTRTPMFISLFWNWVVGMPLSYWMTVHGHFALWGLWIGRATGSLGMAITLFFVWQRKMASYRDKPAQTLASSFETAASLHSGAQA